MLGNEPRTLSKFLNNSKGHQLSTKLLALPHSFMNEQMLTSVRQELGKFTIIHFMHYLQLSIFSEHEWNSIQILLPFWLRL